MSELPVYCPVPKCDRRLYSTWESLRDHLRNALKDGNENHVIMVDLEEWDLSTPWKTGPLTTDD